MHWQLSQPPRRLKDAQQPVTAQEKHTFTRQYHQPKRAMLQPRNELPKITGRPFSGKSVVKVEAVRAPQQMMISLQIQSNNQRHPAENNPGDLAKQILVIQPPNQWRESNAAKKRYHNQNKRTACAKRYSHKKTAASGFHNGHRPAIPKRPQLCSNLHSVFNQLQIWVLLIPKTGVGKTVLWLRSKAP